MPGKPSDKRLELQHFDLAEFVRRVLAEDLGSGGDVTSNATIDADARFTAEMRCREPITVAGLDIAIAFFRAPERDVRIRKEVQDGESISAGTVLMRLDGHARAMLAAAPGSPPSCRASLDASRAPNRTAAATVSSDAMTTSSRTWV